MAKIEEDDLIPYLVRVRKRYGDICYTLIVLSEVHPPDSRSKHPECLNTFGDEVKRLVGPDFIVVEAEVVTWARSKRAMFLDDSAEKIKEFLGYNG